MSQPNGNQQGAEQQQQQQQTQTPAPGSLIAGQAGTEQVQQPVQQPGQGVQGGQQQQAPQAQPPQFDFAAMEQRLQQGFTSEIDRRINGLSQTLQQRLGQPDVQQQQVQQPGNGQQVQPPAQQYPQQPVLQQPVVPQGPSKADEQEARGEYRESIEEALGGKFLGPDERALAGELANAHIQVGLLTGKSADVVGRDAAKAVADRLKAIRGAYETATVNALRQSGQLKDGATTPGAQPLPGAQQPGGASQFAKGASKAAELLPGRFPAQAATTT